MRDYGKVFSRIWESEDFRSMSEDGRALVLYLLTCQHGTIAGVFRVPDGYACEDLQWTAERVAKAFQETLNKGFANRCETTKWVWVFKFLEWNPPENPNQFKAARKIAQSVPDGSCWKLDFMRVCGPSIGIELPKPADPSQTLVEPFLNQEQEQKQEQKQDEEPSASSAAKLPPIPIQAVIDLYHEILPDLPPVRLKTKDRERAIGKTWRWILTSKRTDETRRAETAEQALAWFRSYFERARDNDFLMGRGHRKAEHANWRCDLDFLLTDKGMKHVIEKTLEPA